MKLNLFLFLKKAVSHVSVFYVCQPIIFNLFILIILNLVTVSFDFYLAFTAPDEGEFCLTEILGNKIITLLSCPISLAIGFLFYSTLLIYDLHQDPASPRYCLSKWSLHRVISSYTCCDQIWSMDIQQLSELKVFPCEQPGEKNGRKNHLAANLN